MARIRDSVVEAVSALDPELIERYEEHFSNDLRVDSHQELFRRFVFAFLSVQTAWETNVRLYNRLKNLRWIKKGEDNLVEIFKSEKCGLHFNRARYLNDFAVKFWDRPEWFYPQENEDWQAFRKRLDKEILGLSYTKIAFVIEMVWPHADCVCLDRHMLNKLFGDAKKSKFGFNPGITEYRKFEKQWCWCCNHLGIKPGLARLAYWDTIKGEGDPTFWTACMQTA